MTDYSELKTRFRQSPAVLDASLDGVADEDTTVSPAPGKWTIREIAKHLADTEIVAGLRFRQMIAEEKPALMPFNQDAWAKALDYNKYDALESAAQFRMLREINAGLLDALPSEVLDREGVHAQRGVMTVAQWVDIFTRHVDRHAEQIRAIREMRKAR